MGNRQRKRNQINRSFLLGFEIVILPPLSRFKYAAHERNSSELLLHASTKTAASWTKFNLELTPCIKKVHGLKDMQTLSVAFNIITPCTYIVEILGSCNNSLLAFLLPSLTNMKPSHSWPHYYLLHKYLESYAHGAVIGLTTFLIIAGYHLEKERTSDAICFEFWPFHVLIINYTICLISVG